MIDNIILFVVCSLISAFLRAFRIVLINTDSKVVASLMNSITFAFAAIVIKFVAESTWEVAIVIEFIANFLGCWIAMAIKENEKFNKKFNFKKNRNKECQTINK